MTDVPLSLAVISTVTPVIAGGLPLAVGWIRDARREEREAAERLRAEQTELVRKKRTQCVKLLKLARDFRVLVENTHDSTGAELDAYAEQVRQLAADIASQADKVEFMVPGAETEALALAVKAGQLAAPIANKKNRTAGGSSLPSPKFNDFDRLINEFKQAARSAVGDRSPVLAVDTATDQAADLAELDSVGGGQERRG